MKSDEPPIRDAVRIGADAQEVDVVLHEYDAIRGEIQTALVSQVSILSFGAATVGLLSAAAATLWEDQSLLAGLTLLFIIPLVCFLTLAIYSGELVRLMRAGLFVNWLEDDVNRAFRPPASGPGGPRSATPPGALLLCWEQWRGIRRGWRDVDMLNRLAISLVFLVLAAGSASAGFVCLRTEADISAGWAGAGLAVSGLLGLLSVAWLTRLARIAYSYRGLYRDPPPVARTP